MGKTPANRRLPEKKRKKSAGRGGAPPSGLARDVSAIFLLALGAAVGLALATWSRFDPALVTRGYRPQNLCGPVGHEVASFLYRSMGLSAFLVPVGLAEAGRRLLRHPPRVTAISVLAYGVLTAMTAALLDLAPFLRRLLPFPPGGALGLLFAAPAERLFSRLGSAIVVGAAATVAFILATGIDIREVMSALARWAVSFGRFLALIGEFLYRHFVLAVEEHRTAVAELREEEERAREEEEAVDAPLPEAPGGESVASVPLTPFEDPPWVTGSGPGLSSPEVRAGAGQRRRGAEKKPLSPPDELAAEPLPEEAEFELPPVSPVPPPPEIIVSDAMRESGPAKKKAKKKDAPEFAYEKSGDVFGLPATSLLDVHEEKACALDESGLTKAAEVIVATLKQHGVEGVIRHIRPGPVVTLFEFSPVAGVKLARIENLDKELTMALSAIRIRIIAPIPGKGVVGIEVPNRNRAVVYLKDLLESEAFAHAGGILPLGLGKNIEGIPFCVDLQRMPHLLIAGTTGSGKSVGLNTMILSLLYRQTPAEVRMIMVDPKMTELSAYEDIPHLLLPVVTDPQKAARALQWAVDEMERRTQILADTGSKDLRSYNSKVDKLRAEGRTFGDDDPAIPKKKLVIVDVARGETEEEALLRANAGSPEFEDPTAPPPADPVAALEEKKLPSKLPFIVVIIDELADLMMISSREVEISLARLAQKARATGIHLIVATQRPSTDVITGMIKNNFPARITFRLASRHDSMTIINGPGAETLLGDGDMLVLTANQPLTRAQGAFVSEEELHRVVAYLKEQGKPVFDETILRARDSERGGSAENDEDDPAYDRAIELVSHMDEVSVSKIQREMRLGYNKAAKIIERMEREGIVGPANGVKPRQVLIRPIEEAGLNPNL